MTCSRGLPGLSMLVLCLPPLVASASTGPPELGTLFPEQAEVRLDGGGLARLALPAEILAACRSDLSDLRLFDRDEREVPFLVDGRGPAPDAAFDVVERFEPKVLEVSRESHKQEPRPPLRRETYRLDLPAHVPRAGNWTLVLDPRPRELVARVRVERIGPDGARAALVEHGSLFRLRGPRPVEKLRLPLPPGPGQALEVTLESELSDWIEPVFRLESARRIERAGRIEFPLEPLSTTAQGSRSVVDLTRPRGIVPELIRVATSTGTFDREVTVWDAGPGSDEDALGSGRVFRVEALVPVGEDELALRPARGERLRVEVENGDSPALAQLAFSAVIRQPALIFSLGAGPGEIATLRFGGGRAHAPRYDLAGLALTVGVTGERADAVAALHDPGKIPAARLGPRRPNPRYDARPALEFALRPGAEIDRGAFSHRRSIEVPRAPEGLSRLRLAPADLALLAEDLSDLRVADERSRQWPYLVQRAAVTELVTLDVRGPERRDTASRYRLLPPVERLSADQILLDADAGYFDRAYRLEATTAGGKREVAAGRLVRPIGDPRPATIEVRQQGVESFELIVEDGDDAPLQLVAAQARVRLPELFLAAPEGRYLLLMGAPGQPEPRYELSRVRDVVLAVRAAPVEAGPVEQNPDFRLGARLAGRETGQRVLLWVVLIAAVAVLAGLTLRLARRPAGR